MKALLLPDVRKNFCMGDGLSASSQVKAYFAPAFTFGSRKIFSRGLISKHLHYRLRIIEQMVVHDHSGCARIHAPGILISD